MHLIKISILAGISLLFSCNILFAQSLQKEFDDFNIDNAMQKREELFAYSKRRGLLIPYFLCLAGVRDKVEMCSNLSETDARRCYEKFYYYSWFFSELIMTGQVTSKAILGCEKSSKDMTREQCQKWAEVFLSKDVSACENMEEREPRNECKAIVAQDSRFCGKARDCRDNVSYIEAVKADNVKICDNIKDDLLKMLCKGDVSLNEDVCKQCNGFEDFIEMYHKDKTHRDEMIGKEMIE